MHVAAAAADLVVAQPADPCLNASTCAYYNENEIKKTKFEPLCVCLSIRLEGKKEKEDDLGIREPIFAEELWKKEKYTSHDISMTGFLLSCQERLSLWEPASQPGCFRRPSSCLTRESG